MRDARAMESFYRDAAEAFATARSLVPQEKVYALELATTLDSLGRFEEAEWAFYDALRLDPNSVSVRKSYEGHLERWRAFPSSTEDAATEASES